MAAVFSRSGRFSSPGSIQRRNRSSKAIISSVLERAPASSVFWRDFDFWRISNLSCNYQVAFTYMILSYLLAYTRRSDCATSVNAVHKLFSAIADFQRVCASSAYRGHGGGFSPRREPDAEVRKCEVAGREFIPQLRSVCARARLALRGGSRG